VLRRLDSAGSTWLCGILRNSTVAFLERIEKYGR
jgi:hypothetical protein